MRFIYGRLAGARGREEFGGGVRGRVIHAQKSRKVIKSPLHGAKKRKGRNSSSSAARLPVRGWYPPNPDAGRALARLTCRHISSPCNRRRIKSVYVRFYIFTAHYAVPASLASSPSLRRVRTSTPTVTKCQNRMPFNVIYLSWCR